MGSQRKMSSSFKRASLKSSTSGSQKVSELGRPRSRAGSLVSGSASQSRAPRCRRPPQAVVGRPGVWRRHPPFPDTVPLAVTSWLLLPSCPKPMAPVGGIWGCGPCTYSGRAAPPPTGVTFYTRSPHNEPAFRLSAAGLYAHPLRSITCLWGHLVGSGRLSEDQNPPEHLRRARRIPGLRAACGEGDATALSPAAGQGLAETHAARGPRCAFPRQ